MIAYRRIAWNFSLDRALEWARELKRPLLILEPLRAAYPWACDRFHRFIFDGMAEKIRALAGCRGIRYIPYVEKLPGEGKGLLEALAARASVVVTDDFPCFFLPRMVEAASQKLSARFEAVDSNGLFPLRGASAAFPTAYAFRRFLQKNLSPHLEQLPAARPLHGLSLPDAPAIPRDIARPWPCTNFAQLENPSFLASIPIHHGIANTPLQGGEAKARAALSEFLEKRIRAYSADRNQPDKEVTSGLSPFLHFGHISSHEIFHELMRREKWSDARLSLRATGSRSGWWGVSAAAEEFLDQLIAWRELGFNFCAHDPAYDRYESLSAWAQKTLAKHARDQRAWTYSLEEFASARTHDPLWNAAQRQLIREGRIHNYLRMLWGKKILEWTRSPREALDVMIELNNRYALDGRDPNSYSGIFWCLGRYDRPWGPERPVFGTVRYMSSENTARKLKLQAYLKKFGPESVA